MDMKFRIAFLALVLVGFVDCYGNGPPVSSKPEICDTMLPGHTGLVPENSTSPFSISVENGVTTYTPGKSVTVTIGGSPSFQGFMLMARKMSTNITVGTFSPLSPPNTQLLQCGQTSNNVVGHSSTSVKNNLEFIWNPPNEDNGHVEFVATIAQEKLKVWVQQRSTTHLSFLSAGMSLQGVPMVLLTCTAFVARIFASV